MEFDIASIFAIGACTAFVGAVAWAEVHSRRQRRQGKHEEGASDGASRRPSHSAKPESEK